MALINGISRVLQELLECFNEAGISASRVFPDIFTLNWNDSNFSILSFGSFL